MNGDIGFTSEKNQGSSFWFTFQCEINDIPLMLELDNQHLADKTILYYEENDHSRNATSNILKDWKMQVTSIINRHQLTQLISQTQEADRHFDYVLIGHNQVATALSTLKKTITQLKPISDNVYLALNNNSPSLQDALIASGAVKCMSKPVTSSNLHKLLRPTIEAGAERLTLNSPLRKIIPIKVLAVDDNEANLKLIKALLLEQVAEVIVAENGQAAIELCKTERFSIIFMDIQMPVMDGISALKEIKQLNNHNSETPIIAVTAHALSGEREKMHQQGFNAYMTKPIDETMLRHIIYEYCDFNQLHGTNILSTSSEVNKVPHTDKVIDWPLALTRSANKPDLAKDMFLGLVDSLPETQENIKAAIKSKDMEQLKKLVHKLNGACCYTGVPNLAKITIELETQLKMDLTLEDIEPEIFEFFEHIEQVLLAAPDVLKDLDTAEN